MIALGSTLLGIAAVLALGALTWRPGGLSFALPYSFLMPGVVLGAIGAALLFLGFRRRRDASDGPASGAWRRDYAMRAVRGSILGATILGCIGPEVASAQWRQAPRPFESDVAQVAAPRSDATNSFIIAMIGSAAGVLVGGLVGASIDAARDVPSEDPGLSGFIYGAAAGSALLAPTLLYIANDRRGPFGRAVLLSVGGTTSATVALWPHGAVLVVVPVIQIGVSVALLG